MCAKSCHIARKLRQKWPDAIRSLNEQDELSFPTGLAELDRLFASKRGIPYGQLIEIRGGISSGKTSLLFRILSGRPNSTIAYVDFCHTFFPEATIASGLNLDRLLLIRPAPTRPESDNHDNTLKAGLRTAELLLRDHHANLIAFDLVGWRTALPIGLLHRLRLRTVRAKGLVIFLTQTSGIIPSSMASLRLETKRIDPATPNRLLITITKSRLCAEGVRLEVSL
jgi:hypothetical protein